MNVIPKEKFVAHYVIYLYDWFLEESIENTINFVDKILIARTLKPWNGPEADLSETNFVLNKLKEKYGDKIEIFEDKFKNEQEQRNFLLHKSKEEGYLGAFIIDTDEIFNRNAFIYIYNYIISNNPLALRIPYLTFIKDASFVVAPPYERNLFYVSLKENVFFEWARKTNISATIIDWDVPEVMHFSYLRNKDEDIWHNI